jgi:molybdopterin-guanine dinucleotide biosynthesis protein A
VSAEQARGNRVGTVGAILAGGAGRRIGGDKAAVGVEGRPLVQWVVDAITPVADDVAVIAKRDTLLPALAPEVSLWLEPDSEYHPLLGIVHALDCAQGRAILAVAADMPLITSAVLNRLNAPSDGTGRVARVDGRLQPLCARYEPSVLALLRGFEQNARATDVVLDLGLEIIDFDDPLPFFNVNAPEDLLTAGAELKRRSAAD